MTYLTSENRSLHQFADSLDTYAKGDSVIAVAQALGTEQQALSLLWRELGERGEETRQALNLQERFLGIQRRINTHAHHAVRVGFIAAIPAPFGAMQVHREIVSGTKHPNSKFVVRSLACRAANQAKERLLNDVFRAVMASSPRAEVGIQRGCSNSRFRTYRTSSRRRT